VDVTLSVPPLPGTVAKSLGTDTEDGETNIPRVHRVFEPGKPRFQLRPGEEGLSVFDAQSVNAEDILPHFRPGSLITTKDIALIKSFGLNVIKTQGDPNLPTLLQERHYEIRPGAEMVESPGGPTIRTQFKAALKKLEKAASQGDPQ